MHPVGNKYFHFHSQHVSMRGIITTLADSGVIQLLGGVNSALRWKHCKPAPNLPRFLAIRLFNKSGWSLWKWLGIPRIQLLLGYAWRRWHDPGRDIYNMLQILPASWPLCSKYNRYLLSLCSLRWRLLFKSRSHCWQLSSPAPAHKPMRPSRSFAAVSYTHAIPTYCIDLRR